MHAHDLSCNPTINLGPNYYLQSSNSLEVDPTTLFKNKKVISDIPELDTNFCGRVKFLSSLNSKFTECKNNLCKQCIKGISGIGKTQLAIKYIEMYKSNYNLVYWFNAECDSTETKIDTEYRKFAQQLGIYHETELTSNIINLVNRKLAMFKSSLLIFDNVINANSIRKFLPKRIDEGKVHILITSWDAPIDLGLNNILDLEDFEKDDAINYIQNFFSCSNNVVSPQAAWKLAKILTSFPLALSQAVSYIYVVLLNKSTKGNIDPFIEQYIKLFEEDGYKMKLLSYLPKNIAHGEDKESIEKKKTTYKTWEISRIKISNNPNAEKIAEILNICAYLNANSIPKFIFSNTAPEKIFSDNQLEETLCLLNELSLIKATDGTKCVQIHRLLQEVIRIHHKYNHPMIEENNIQNFKIKDFIIKIIKLLQINRLLRGVTSIFHNYSHSIAEKSRTQSSNTKISIIKVIQLLNSKWQFNRYNLNTWEQTELLLPHVITLQGFADKEKIICPEYIELLIKFGFYQFHVQAHYESAIKVLQNALKVNKDAYKAKLINMDLFQENMSLIYKYLGSSYAGIGENKALEFLLTALDIDKNLNKANFTFKQAKALDYLGDYCDTTNQHYQQVVFYWMSLAIKILIGKFIKDADKKIVLIAKLKQFLSIDVFAPANKICDQEINNFWNILCKEVLPLTNINDSEIALSLCELGNAFGYIGYFQHQLELLLKVKDIEENLYKETPTHPELGATYHEIGCAYGNLKDYKNQKLALENALAIKIKVFENRIKDANYKYPLHPEVASTLRHLAKAYFKSKEEPQFCETLFQDTIYIYKQVHGVQHINVALTLYDYAKLLKINSNTAATKNCCLEATDIINKITSDGTKNLKNKIIKLLEACKTYNTVSNQSKSDCEYETTQSSTTTKSEHKTTFSSTSDEIEYFTPVNSPSGSPRI